MARLVEQATGHRMIRLSVQDILTVVSLYQQAVKQTSTQNHAELCKALAAQTIYLPEEPSGL